MYLDTHFSENADIELLMLNVGLIVSVGFQ